MKAGNNAFIIAVFYYALISNSVALQYFLAVFLNCTKAACLIGVGWLWSFAIYIFIMQYPCCLLRSVNFVVTYFSEAESGTRDKFNNCDI